MNACPKCGAEGCTKDGLVGNRQRYKCKFCNYRHTVQQRGFGSDIRRQALMLYLHGLCFRAIGEILQCSHVTVHNWIKSYGKGIEEIRSKTGVEMVKIEEMHSLLATKKNDTGPGLLLIDMENHKSPALCVAKPKATTNNDCNSQDKSNLNLEIN